MSSVLQKDSEAANSRELQFELARLFGHERFFGKQEEVIRQVLAGKDTLAVMPTGSGKSLCYQLPAMLLPGATVVISPLIALMKDQYDSLPGEVYERTTFVNSSLEADALSQRIDEIVAGRYKLIYCAPERLRQQPFVDALRRAGVSLLVVDEAHCVSMWGHDFRPDYLFIGKCLPLLGDPPLLALTATATPAIREEIAAQLGRELTPVIASVFRPNLYYQVEELADKEQKLRRLLEICREEKGPGVVYARSRETCEQLAAMLRRSGVLAEHYHAGMTPEARTRTQERFMLDRVRVMVATIAFGMGVDKSNVRFIVHFSPPDSLESYVQESGRAGRDGRPSKCILFTTPGDRANITRWKRQEQLKVEELREIYRELTRLVPVGEWGYVNFDALRVQAGAAVGAEMDETKVRVAVSLLERVGLIVRHPDAPRTATIRLNGAHADDPQFERFLRVAALNGETARREMGALARGMEMPAPTLERLLLSWDEQSRITFRGERRDAVIERLQPPSDTAAAINLMLTRKDQAQQQQVDRMLTYAAEDTCRHKTLASHLGEEIEECGTSCDFCAPPDGRPAPTQEVVAELPDNPGRVIVECLASFPFAAGKPSVARALQGSAASNVNASRVRHFGALAGATASAIGRAIDELVEGGYLAYFEEDGFRLLRVTREGLDGVPRGAVSLKPKRQPKPKEVRVQRERRTRAESMQYPAAARAAEEELEPTPEEADLFERLRAWRRVVANRQGLPPYMVAHDRTLWALAKAQPKTAEELASIRGVGKSIVEKYGPDLLSVLAGEE